MNIPDVIMNYQAVRKLDVELPDGAKLFNVKQKDF